MAKKKILGTVKLLGCTLPVTRASFGYVADEELPGWDFNVCTDRPIEIGPKTDESIVAMLSNGVRFYAEADPIPLENADDLTGTVLKLAEPYDPVSGEVYFTFFLCEHNDVSNLKLRFVERKGQDYRMTVSGLVSSGFKKPPRFEIDTWIKRLPAK